MKEPLPVMPPVLRMLPWGIILVGFLLLSAILFQKWRLANDQPRQEALGAAAEVGLHIVRLMEGGGDLLEEYGRILLTDPDVAAALTAGDVDLLREAGEPLLARFSSRLRPPSVTFIDADGAPLVRLPRSSAPSDIPPFLKKKGGRQIHLAKDGGLTLAVAIMAEEPGGGGVILQRPLKYLAAGGVEERGFHILMLGAKASVDRRQWEERQRREGWSVRWERLGNLIPLGPLGVEQERVVTTLEMVLTPEGALPLYALYEGSGGRVEVASSPLPGPMSPGGVWMVGIRPLKLSTDRGLIGLWVAALLLLVGLVMAVVQFRRTLGEGEVRRSDMTERLAEISRIARLGLWEWRPAHRTFRLSEEAQRILGFGSKEAAITYDRFMERVHPADRREVGERVAWPRPGDMTFRTLLEDGTVRSLRGSLAPSADRKGEVVGYVQDLTELAKTQAELAESELRYRGLSMAATEGIVIHDGGVIVDVNNAFCRLMEGGEEELVGKNLLDLAQPEDIALLAARLESERDRPERFHLRSMTGRTVVVDITSRSAPSRGRIVRMSAIRDVTGEVRAEENVESQRRLLAQTDRLRSLGTLVAGVAHEINNPNSFVMFNAPLIERAWKDAMRLLDEREAEKGSFTLAGMPYKRVRGDVLSFVENILSGARRIQEIVEKLRSFVGGATPGEMELVDPSKAAEEGVALLAPLITRRKGVVSVRAVGRVLPIRGRAAEIGQVVVNLVANALQALPEEGGEVTVKTVGEADKGTVAIIVEDNGTGIPEEELEKLFDPFYTTKRNEGGSGLGLSISHTIVEEHGGRLIFESTPGVGTRVTARFPVADTPR